MPTTNNAGVTGISTGGILVLAGLALWFFLDWAFVGVLLILVGLIAFGGFVRGRWY